MSNVMSPTPQERTKWVRRAILAGVIGTTIEWYDFVLFGTASALVFNTLFFPQFDPLIGTAAALTTTAIGYFFRPLGGFVFGALGDRIGRKNVLAATLVLMGLSTALIGLLPTYAQAGIWAPILMLVLRILQGIGAGAEFGGAQVMVSEHASKKRQGLLTSLPGAGLALGIMLGTSFYSLLDFMPKDEFMAWGWRLPFLASVIGIVVGLLIRMRVMESPEYLAVTRTKEKPKSPVREVFASYKRNWFVAMFACFAENATTNLVKTFVLAYAATFLHLDKSVGLNGLFVASLVSLFTYPLFGWLGDRLGIGRVYIGSAIAVALFIFPMFWMIDTKSVPTVIVAIVIIYAIAVRGMSATQGAYLANLFPARIRFTGLASSREVGSAISGGLGPVLATLLLAATHSYWPVAIYMISQAAITIAAVWIGPSKRTPIDVDVEEEAQPAPRALRAS
ncbi:MFS transporter [Sinomonas sp. ASV486]|uniref:MFS transporter n=1 Tax=Sinomonas puerhi TaxID=3238584 RepID=A0AB39L2U7_9MICC|nr:MFS transporter [Sinomonas sp. ASV486]MDQ4489430.1 MFS transporter [Sinomonas sp. ASV486]